MKLFPPSLTFFSLSPSVTLSTYSSTILSSHVSFNIYCQHSSVLQVVGLNFSSATSPELLLKTFDHYCEYRRTPNGMVMAPIQLGKWMVLFCDEINLPDTDKYGTQRVISFLRQIVEHGGFFRTSDQTWIMLERIQFVGACNPPTDPGRKPLSHR